MKKRIVALLVGAFVIFNTLGSDIVAVAGENEEPTIETQTDIQDAEIQDETQGDEDDENEDNLGAGDPTAFDFVDFDFSAQDFTEANLLATSLAETGANGATFEQNPNLVDKLEIKKGEADFKTGDSLSLNDTLSVKYLFKTPIAIIPSADADLDELGASDEDKKLMVVTGEEYSLPAIPEVCKLAGSEIKVYFTGDEGQEEFGTITINNGSAVFKVTYVPDGLAHAKNAYAGFDLQLDDNALSSQSNNNGVYILDFGDLGSYTVKVDEYKLNEPIVNKTGEKDVDAEGNPTGYINWTVTLTNDSDRPISYEGYTFTDTMDKDQTYKAGSLKLKGESVNPTSTSPLTWTYTGDDISDKGKTLAYTYQTYVDTLGLVSKTNVESKETVSANATNKVKVTGKSNSEGYSDLSINSDEVKIPMDVKLDSWIAKTGSSIDSDGNTTWTVNIKNNGFTLYKLHLIDTITPDSLSNAKRVTIDLKDVTVKDGATTLNKDTDYTYTYENNVLDIAFTNPMAGANKEYVVTYKTQILNYDKYLKENHGIPSNKAKITYEYDKNGIIENTGSPEVGKNFFEKKESTYKASIEKTAAGVDYVNHQMNWLIQVNKNKQPLTGVSIEDAIPKGQKFVGISNVKIDDKAVSDDNMPKVTGENSAAPVITFVNSLNGHAASFVVTTELDDTQNFVWANNKTKDYTNTVTLSSDGNDHVEDSVTQTYASKVLEKSASTYNYDTHEITYTITVNKNNMMMGNVVVKDKLDDRLEYIDASVEGAHLDSYSNNELTFSLGTIKGETTFTFRAKVKDGEWLKKTGTVSIPNTATLTSDQYGNGANETPVVADSNKVSIVNKLLTKTGEQDSTNKEVVNFTVQINPGKQDLYEGVTDNTVIKARDTMGSSLTLMDDSVKLFKATVNPTNGQLTATGESIITSDDVAISVNDDGKTVLEVTLPKNGGKTAYVLTYTAKMLDASQADISNSISLVGSEAVEENAAEWNYKQSQFAGAGLDKYVYLAMKLVDQNDPSKPLAGARFQLIDPETGKVIEEKVTNSKGEIVFNGKGSLKPNTSYIIKEVKIPDGYEISTTADTDLEVPGHTVTTLGTGLSVAKNNIAANTVVNTKPSTDIDIKLVDRDDTTKDLTAAGTDGVITITDQNGNRTTLTGGKSEFTAVQDVEYTVKESTTPFGYNGDSTSGVTFKVGSDGKVQFVGDNGIDAENDDSSITLKDHQLKSVEVQINDVSEQGRYLSDAEFELAYNDEKNVVKTWKSNGDYVTYTLPEGTYWLRRTNAPAGFLNDSKAVKFTVSSDLLGTHVEFDDASNQGDLQITEKKVVVPEKADPSKQLTLDDEATSNGTAKIYPVTYKDGQATGTADEPLENPVLDPGTEYVMVTKDAAGNTIRKVVVVALDENGDPVLVEKSSTTTPAPSANNGGNGGSSASYNTTNIYYGTGKTAATDEMKDKEIYAGENLDAGAAGQQLAKTGGFTGTVFGYLAAVAMILVGCVLVFGKKKNYSK